MENEDGSKNNLNKKGETEKTDAEKVLGSMPNYDDRNKINLPIDVSVADIMKTVSEDLDTSEKIDSFLQQRIKTFEEETEEKTVGQNFTDGFREFISSKIHYKSAEVLPDGSNPDLVYDDMNPYRDILANLHKSGGYALSTLCNAIYYEIDNYLPSGDKVGFDRMDVYLNNHDGKVSIKDISERKVAFCSEKAGLAHNILKLLGYDAELVTGARNSEFHAYNLVYLKGNRSGAAALFDPSFFLNFKNDDGTRYSLAFLKPLSETELSILKSGKPLTIDDWSKTEEIYKKRYPMLNDSIIEENSSCYVYGLEPAKQFLAGE